MAVEPLELIWLAVPATEVTYVPAGCGVKPKSDEDAAVWKMPPEPTY